MQSQRLQELEEVSKELLKVLLSDWAAVLLRRGLERGTRGAEKLLSTQNSSTQLLRDLSRAEEKVAQNLLEREGQIQNLLQELQELERELGWEKEREQNLQRSNHALRGELQRLRKELQSLEEGEEEEEGGGALPAAAYVTQLYHKITRIDWDYDADPSQIRGIHYGPPIAHPINIDASGHSRCFLSDYLWSLVPTEW